MTIRTKSKSKRFCALCSRTIKGHGQTACEGVAQQSRLNRRILDSGWGQLVRFVEYKLDRRGGKTGRVKPAYTSQTCSSCFANPINHPDSTSRDGKLFKCHYCEMEMDADLNAAKVIQARGEGNSKAYPSKIHKTVDESVNNEKLVVSSNVQSDSIITDSYQVT